MRGVVTFALLISALSGSTEYGITLLEESEAVGDQQIWPGKGESAKLFAIPQFQIATVKMPQNWRVHMLVKAKKMTKFGKRKKSQITPLSGPLLLIGGERQSCGEGAGGLLFSIDKDRMLSVGPRASPEKPVGMPDLGEWNNDGKPKRATKSEGTDSGKNSKPLSTGDPLPSGRTFSLDFTWEEQSKKARIYVDGSLAAAGTKDWQKAVKLKTEGNAITALANCHTRKASKGTFSGRIGDVRIFSGVDVPAPPVWAMIDKMHKSVRNVDTIQKIPKKFRVHFRFRTKQKGAQAGGSILISGGKPESCSGLHFFYKDQKECVLAQCKGTGRGVFGFGVISNGGGSDPPLEMKEAVSAGVAYDLDFTYNKETGEARIFVDGRERAKAKKLTWNFPGHGSVTLLNGCHNKDIKPMLQSEVSDLRLYNGASLVPDDAGRVSARNCKVTEWGEFSKCSKECGGGTQV